MNTTLVLNQLTIGYRSKKHTRIVAENINANINAGELTCILGANGVGKSTLLRTLSAFQPPLSGQILLKGKDIQTYTEKSLARLIGVVLTEKLDIKNMTARELVSLGRSPYTGFWGKLVKGDEEIVDEAFRLVKIENLSERLLHTLSDGERQKAMIAKALAQQSPVILLDEPTAFLDFPSKVEMMQLLHYLSQQTNKTIFLSTHDLELALQIADKIWLMDKEQGIRIGTPEDLSIDGSLNSFFIREGIVFDQQSGLFRIENTCHLEMKLLGEGQLYAMIQKALLRNGIKSNPDVISKAFIEIKNQQIIYHPATGESIPVKNIADLLTQIHRS
jgi:iron complex transport system ATP-binding protein